ncbi:hypothetical protein HQ576_17635, partial [bacterium]|nr:hypothetical protein [bacterium]
MRPRHMAFLLTTQTLLVACALAAGKVAAPPAVIVHSPDAGAREQLAAREVRRYVYLRTGLLLPIRAGLPAQGNAILVGVKNRELFKSPGGAGPPHEAIARLGPQQYLLRTAAAGARRVLLVVGGDDVGTLYGAYRLAECLGVRFFLHGDVVPDQQVPWQLPQLDETGKPLFELRGLNPWGSHPFGLDLWNTDDWKAHIGQLAKLRMNFIGAHCYPEGRPYAEPTVWTGLPGDFDASGRVAFSYPTSFYTALFRPPWGGLKAGKTSAYHLGAAMLFDRDDWGPDVMRGHAPRPTAPAACNEVFNRTAAMFREAFTFARLVGVKTCLGTEAPLTIPRAVRERLKQQGKNPADPAVVQEVYEGMFRRIMAAHPLDYYWLWTPESWTWRGNTAAQLKATVEDVRIAREALRTVGAPFRLATSGWVLGPANDRAALDRMISQEIALSAIGRHLGEDPVDPAFGRVKRRDKWAIPWMEGDNGGLAIPQLWVGRTRQDAADARVYGCTGLMGLMWRTRILGPNIAALAQAGWAQPWNRTGDEPGAPAVRPEGARGGKVANYPRAAIARTDDDALYQTCRYDLHG